MLCHLSCVTSKILNICSTISEIFKPLRNSNKDVVRFFLSRKGSLLEAVTESVSQWQNGSVKVRMREFSLGLSSSARICHIIRYFQTRGYYPETQHCVFTRPICSSRTSSDGRKLARYFPNSGIFWKQDQDFSGYFLDQISR